jgi:hypothetical protein
MDRKAFVVAVLLFSTGARAEHPLITDDINTQGKGGWQLELNAERYRDYDAGADQTITGRQAAAQVSYGLVDSVDVQFGVPYHDNGTNSGAGDVSLDVKWRFHESGPLKLGIKPGITLPTGKSEDGLGTGRATWGMVAVMSYDTALGAVLANAGYRHSNNTTGERKDLKRLSAAILPKIGESLRLVLDVAFDTNPDPAAAGWLRQTVVGFVYAVNKDFDFDLGYRRGNEPSIDRAVMAGITLRW